MTLLRRIYEFAPEGVRKYMQWRVMPTDEERKQPLGTSGTLSSRLLRLSSSPVAPSMRENISSLLFELSDKDATSFVQNIGLGFASGFLMTHNVPIPENAMEAWSSGSGNNNGNGANGGSAVNPITGQRLEAEHPAKMDPMTNEEKEREAERLFVLFERSVSLASSPLVRATTALARLVRCLTHTRDTTPGSRRPASSTSRTPSNRLCTRVDSKNSTTLTRSSTSTRPFSLCPHLPAVISTGSLSRTFPPSSSSKAAQSIKSHCGATASDHLQSQGLGPLKERRCVRSRSYSTFVERTRS